MLQWIEGFAAVLLILSVLVTLRPRLLLAGVVAVFSAAWWPLNNRVIEGATLIAVTPRHGLTVNDLLGILGFVCSTIAMLRAPNSRAAKRACLTGALLVLIIGVSAAYLTGG